MKIKEIVEELKKPNITIDILANSIDGISQKKLREAFKKAGYKHENSGQKGWHFKGSGEEPLDKSIFDFLYPSNVKSAKAVSSPNNSPLVNKGNKTASLVVEESKGRTSRLSHNDSALTREEIAILKEIAQEALREKEYQTKRDILHKRIMGLERGETTRKTIIISEEIGEKLDEFAKQTRFNKSNLLEIAILDLINRYE